MSQSNNPFQKVGIALLVIGIMDIGYMIYSIFNGFSYTSSFNIFAVVAGIFLIRGNLIAALITRFFVTFFAALVFGIVILYFYLTPIDLIMVQIKLQSTSILSFALILSCVIAILIWMCIQFSTSESIQAFIGGGYKSTVPKLISFSAVAAGTLLMILIGVFFNFFYSSEVITKAVKSAQDQYGNNYQYHVTSFNIENDYGIATVIAYNNEAIKVIEVEW
tara:strand:+ start:1254 stop:1913 length:660 start_codon:yes stop_codon:yes gene_type:complete